MYDFSGGGGGGTQCFMGGDGGGDLKWLGVEILGDGGGNK